MAIQKIEEIYINGVQGQFAGGYIYSMKMNRGYSESPSKVTISIVLDNNAKEFNIPATSLQTSYSIKIGSLVMPNMYFIAYNKSVSVGQKILSCDFIDSSFNLDRFFVGLLNRHAAGDVKLQIDWNATINCVACGQDSVTPISTIITQISEGIENANVGSLIIVGQEEFVAGSCDVPDVKYTFDDLKKVFPITLNNFPSNSIARANYTGTLREVLSNWVSDFGGSFTFNPFTNVLDYIDLTNPIPLDGVKSYIESSFGNSSLAISSYEYSETKEGTYSQRVGTYFLKSPRSSTTSSTYYSPINLRCEKVFGENYDNDDLITSVLSLYDTRLRTIYLSFMLNSGGEDFQFGARKLGLDVISNLNVNGVFNLGIATLRDVYTKNPGGKFILTRVNQGNADNYLEYDRARAEAVGKKYTLRNFPVGTRGIKGNLISYVGRNIEYCSDANTKISISYEVFPNVQVPSSASYYGYFERSTATYDPAPGEIVFYGDIDNYLPSYMEVEGEVFSKLIEAGVLGPNSDINGLKIIYIPPGNKAQVASMAIGGGRNSKEEGLTQEIPANTKDCLSDCINYVDEVCAKEKCGDTKSIPPVKGLSNDNQNISVNILNTTVHLPFQSDYLGYLKTTESVTSNKKGYKKIVPSTTPTNPEAMALKYVSHDITTADQEGIAEIEVGAPGSYDVLAPAQSISIKIIGLNYGTLADYINSSRSIIDSFNVILDENGIFSDFTFKTKPVELPQKERIMQRVTPQKITIIK